VTNSLTSPPVRSLLDRLFQAAAGDDARRAGLAERHPSGFATVSAREQADAYQDMYIPVSPEGGRLLYTLIRASRPSTVVEFGTSFGISTIHLGAATVYGLRDTPAWPRLRPGCAGTWHTGAMRQAGVRARRVRSDLAPVEPRHAGH
jgi:hypothetical protein